MSQPSSPLDLPPRKTEEVVAEFASKASFEEAVRALLRSSFERSDISVLATHDSLAIADEQAHGAEIQTEHAAAVFGIELPWLAPLALAEVLLAASGPIGLAVAGIVAAGAGAVALQPLLREVTETSHAESFSEALKRGQILLWVRVTGQQTAERAEHLLKESGGAAIRRITSATVRG